MYFIYSVQSDCLTVITNVLLTVALISKRIYRLCWYTSIIRLYIKKSVRLSVCPFVRLSVCPSVRLSVCPSVRLSVCPSVRLSVCPSVRLSVCPSVRLYVCPSVYMYKSVLCLSACCSVILLFWLISLKCGQVRCVTAAFVSSLPAWRIAMLALNRFGLRTIGKASLICK
jgi:hypothetical protein